MPPRQGRICGFLVGHGQGRQAAKKDTKRRLRELQDIMESMERKNSENTDTGNEEESFKDERWEVTEDVKVLKILMKDS